MGGWTKAPVVALRRWSRECVGREDRVGFGADKRCLGTTSEGRERIRRTRLQKRSKQMATEQQRAEESTRGEAMRKKRTRMRQDAEMQPSLAWKWSSFWKGPQRRVRYPRLTPGPLLGAPQLAVGQWGQAACRAPGLALADGAAPLLRSTCAATAHKVGSTWRMWHSAGCC